MPTSPDLQPHLGDALIIVDLQQDSLPGGNLAVPHGDEVVAVLNHYIESFNAASLPIFATRDWHSQDRCSFTAKSGAGHFTASLTPRGGLRSRTAALRHRPRFSARPLQRQRMPTRASREPTSMPY